MARIHTIRILPVDGTVLIHQAHEDFSAGASIGRSRKQDRCLPINRGSRIRDCRQLAAGGIGDAVNVFLLRPCLAVILGDIVAAMAGEHIDSAISLHQCGLRALFAHISAAMPSLTAIVRINNAGVAITSGIGIAREDDSTSRGHQTAARADTVEILVVVFYLGIQHGGLRPSLAAIGGLRQIQIAGAQHLERRVREKQICGIVIRISEIEILIDRIIRKGRTIRTANLIAVQIIVVSTVSALFQQEMAVTVKAGTRTDFANISTSRIQVYQHIDSVTVCGQAGINECRGTGIGYIAMVA